MAGLPLYLMAIPLRRSLAAGIRRLSREAEFTHSVCKRNCLGSARVSRAGERVLAIANFSLTILFLRSRTKIENQVRFGGTPKPARETRALPRWLLQPLYNNFNRVRSCESTIPTGTL